MQGKSEPCFNMYDFWILTIFIFYDSLLDISKKLSYVFVLKMFTYSLKCLLINLTESLREEFTYESSDTKNKCIYRNIVNIQGKIISIS